MSHFHCVLKIAPIIAVVILKLNCGTKNYLDTVIRSEYLASLSCVYHIQQYFQGKQVIHPNWNIWNNYSSKMVKCFQTARNTAGKKLFSTLLTEHRQHKISLTVFVKTLKCWISNLHMKTTLTQVIGQFLCIKILPWHQDKRIIFLSLSLDGIPFVLYF